MKINFKKLFLIIIFTIIIGGLFSFLTINNDVYKNLIKPIEIPPILFPIIWTTLYILMSISIYIISESNENPDTKKSSYILYIVQLIMNSLWTLVFFGLNWYLFAAIWIVLLLIVVIIMTIKFGKINKVAAYLQIPYILWLAFALYLNFSIYLLN